MSKRHRDALGIINPGACNPSGITISLLDGIREAREEGADTDGIRGDPALRLMCYQLSSLFGIWKIEHDLNEYNALETLCNIRAEADKVA